MDQEPVTLLPLRGSGSPGHRRMVPQTPECEEFRRSRPSLTPAGRASSMSRCAVAIARDWITIAALAAKKPQFGGLTDEITARFMEYGTVETLLIGEEHVAPTADSLPAVRRDTVDVNDLLRCRSARLAVSVTRPARCGKKSSAHRSLSSCDVLLWRHRHVERLDSNRTSTEQLVQTDDRISNGVAARSRHQLFRRKQRMPVAMHEIRMAGSPSPLSDVPTVDANRCPHGSGGRTRLRLQFDCRQRFRMADRRFDSRLPAGDLCTDFLRGGSNLESRRLAIHTWIWLPKRS